MPEPTSSYIATWCRDTVTVALACGCHFRATDNALEELAHLGTTEREFYDAVVALHRHSDPGRELQITFTMVRITPDRKLVTMLVEPGLRALLFCEPAGVNPCPYFVITANPTDYPGRHVVREHRLQSGRHEAAVAPLAVVDTLEQARAALPPGLARLPRHETDDPVIVETWL